MNPIQQLAEVFEADGWSFSRPREEVLSSSIQGENGVFPLIVHHQPEYSRLTVYARAPINCPAERRDELGRLVLMLNYGLAHGCFDLDLRDGELRFRAAVDYLDQPPTKAQLSNLVLYSITAMDAYLPALLAVVHGGKEASQAYDIVPRP